MTAMLERVPLDEINLRAQQVRPGRTVLTLIAGALFGLGWLTARVFAVAWLALTWSWAAASEGWEASHGPSRGQQIMALNAEVEGLREKVRRLGG
jgi:hypothetical protein